MAVPHPLPTLAAGAAPTLASPAPPLQHIFHPDRLAHVARNREAGRFEAWGSDGDRRIARNAEAFRRHDYRLVHLVVAILVVDNRNRIGPLRGGVDGELSRLGGLSHHHTRPRAL